MEIDGFRGWLITADDADYDIARAVWNGAIDWRPRLIARCIGTADVRRPGQSMDEGVLRRARGLPRGRYVNFLGGDEDRDRVREAYGASVYDRLVEVKTTYDPENVFHHNQNIPRLSDGMGATGL